MPCARWTARHYIEANKHNLNEPRVFVHSAYRNSEWQAVAALAKGEPAPWLKGAVIQ